MTDLPAIISRSEAIALGLNRFFTGKPCKHGHIAEFSLSVRPCGRVTQQCMECAKGIWTIANARRHKGPAPTLTLQPDGSYIGWPCRKCGCVERGPGKKCRNCTNLTKTKRRKFLIENDKEYREKAKEQYKKYKHLHFRKSARRRTRQKEACPLWLSDKQNKSMEDFYKLTPAGHSVDHIVPLISDVVCGLHVPWNFQYLPEKENSAKRNKFPTCQRSMQPAWFDDKI